MSKKILVVDDEQDVLNYLTALFQDNGYQTVTAGDGLKAVEAARAEKPDLITLDITMPDQSGIRTYRQYKQDPALKKIPVIIITAMGEDVNTFIKRLQGFVKPEGFMSKPIDPDRLVEMTAGLLAARP
ncbi:MAG: response regulator [Thermodesulfobacteriota bacterium]